MRKSLPSLMRLSCLAVALLAPASAVASSPQLIGLERDLSALLLAHPGEYGIAALDLRDGSSVAINGDTSFPMASTIKVAIAAAYLSQVDEGLRSLDDTLGSSSAARTMQLMLVHSDNVAADRMLATLGGPAAVQEWLRSRAILGIRMDRTIAQLLRERGHINDSKDVATPNAMVTLLAKLDEGALLSAQSRAFLFDLMGRCETGTRRIRALLPAGVAVEDKTGTLNGVTNDVGFITMPDGHRVAVAIFARGGRDRQSGIAETARKIYERFADPTRSAVSYFMRLR